MYLSCLRLWNFRKFGSDSHDVDIEKPDLVVPFTKGVNVLIGENDSGKTAIIDAIKLALDTHSGEWIRLVPEDFHRGTNRLRIECRFDDFREEEAMHFTEWLGMEGEGVYATPYLKVILDASKRGNEHLHYDVRAGADDEGHLFRGEVRDYLRTTYLKPLRDAKSELVPRRNSRLAQILSGLSAFKGDGTHQLRQISRCFDCLLQKYFRKDYTDDTCAEEKCRFEGYFYSDGPKASEGGDIREALQAMINEFIGRADYQAVFSVMNRELRNILDQFRLSLTDEELGLGSHNLLFIAAELLNLRRKEWTGLRLALIEELEAHLHPQAQLRVIEYLQKSDEPEPVPYGSKENSGKRETEPAERQMQVILTTHSPNLGSKVKLKNLLICCEGHVFPMGPQHTKLDEPDYSFLERFLDVTKANLFFAKGVILVEGPSEELILPVLASRVGRDLTQKGVSVVNVGSTAFLRYAKVFERRDEQQMNIPVAVVTDLDVKPEDEDKDVNRRTLKYAKEEDKENKYNGQKVRTFISPHWTFEYCIARSEQLAPYLFEAIKAAIREMRKDGKSISEISEIYEELYRGNRQEEIASRMYEDLIKKKDISKPTIAQHFARILGERQDITEDILNNSESTKYLIDAIKHVTD